jgi:hypothetical protein
MSFHDDDRRMRAGEYAGCPRPPLPLPLPLLPPAALLLVTPAPTVR